jgi:hypothetical protein
VSGNWRWCATRLTLIARSGQCKKPLTAAGRPAPASFACVLALQTARQFRGYTAVSLSSHPLRVLATVVACGPLKLGGMITAHQVQPVQQMGRSERFDMEF